MGPDTLRKTDKQIKGVSLEISYLIKLLRLDFPKVSNSKDRFLEIALSTHPRLILKLASFDCNTVKVVIIII